MNDLRNTIAHILEHRKRLEHSNEALTKPEAIAKQYVILPILRTLGWNDTNLVSIEVMPEYKVDRKSVDYALTVEQIPKVFIECKKWEDPLTRHEEQICFYAYSKNVPLAVITNGRIWRFYLSEWQATSLSDRIFCETDIENRENAISNLEQYLLKSNVASGEAELNAEIVLEEKGKSGSSEISREWTVERVINSLSNEVRDDHEKYTEERRKLFYRGAAGVQNLIQKERWQLDMKISKVPCSFFLRNKGVMGINRVFGIILPVHLPHGSSVDRNGKVIGGSLKLTPPRIFVRIMEDEAEQLERQDGCEFCAISKDSPVDFIYYNIPENMSKLLPVLEFAYNKHLGN